MKVIIENLVAFDNAACRLSNIQTADEVVISLVHAQLLTLLINHRGFAVSRNEIFEKIFDANGAHATNNNLNQNISILRKHLSQLGIEREVITTVNLVGFMIDDSVLVEIYENDPPAALDEARPVPVGTAVATSALRIKKQVFFLGMLAVALGVFGVHLRQQTATKLTPNNLPQLAYTKSDAMQGCEVNKLSVRGAGDDYFSGEQFQDAIRSLKCNTPDNTRFYISRNTVSNHNYRSFTLKCIRTASGQHDCYSIYESVEVE